MVTIQQQPYVDFMKEVISFCELACQKYHIPILLIDSATERICRITRVSSSLESPFLKTDSVYFSLRLRLQLLEKATLNITDQKHFTQEALVALDPRDAKIVFIDDLAAVPSLESLEKWATEKGLKVIARKD